MGSTRPETLAVFTEWTAERYGELPALRFRRAAGDRPGLNGSAVGRAAGTAPAAWTGGNGTSGWTEVTYDALCDRVRDVGRGLLGLGVRPGDRVAILAETGPLWTYAHFGVLATGAVLVPVYPTAGDEEVAWVLSDSGAGVVLCGDEALAAKVERLRAERPGPLAGLRHVRLLGTPYPDPVPVGELLLRAAAVPADATAALVYTSGTTGLPKGCRLLHANFNAVRDGTAAHTDAAPGDCTYIYLPLAHLLAQLTEMATLLDGATLAYFGGRIEDVVSELAEARPTHLPSVPRLFEKVHSTVAGLAEAQGDDGGRRFAAAVRTGLEVADLRDAGKEIPEDLAERHREADERLFALVRTFFGGRLRRPISGGAPIAPQTLDFMRACGLTLYEGYGMTESAGIISLSRPGANRQGKVGRPIDGCEVRIAEDGEVLARGPMIFPGYHGDGTGAAGGGETGATLDADGWLHTGDLGELDADGYLSITGRKKELIITSAGKNITPSQVEFAIQQSRWISRAVLIGDRRPYPVALVTLDAEEVAKLGVTGPPSRDAEVRRRVREAIDAANDRAARPARVRAWAILDGDFTVEAGELTPTLKVRREEIARRYARAIDALYEE